MSDVIPLKRRDANSLGEYQLGDTIPNQFINAQAPDLYGIYANRPAANTVPIGTLYFSTDTKDCHKSDGTIWAIAGSGGEELGYSERTSAFSTTSTTLVDIPGLTVTTKVGDRPILVSFGGNLRVIDGGSLTMAMVVNGVTRSQVVYSGVPYMFLGRAARISDLVAGSNPTIKLQLSTTAGNASCFGSTSDRPYLLVVNL